MPRRQPDFSEVSAAVFREGAADDDVSDDDDDFVDLSFFFEGSQPTIIRRFEWNATSDIHNAENEEENLGHTMPVRVVLRAADGDPGAVQSGHYLWPAAPALCEHLMGVKKAQPTCIVELGSGCGLVSLAAMQIFHRHLQTLVMTDHDPGTLDRARDNYNMTMKELSDDLRNVENGIFKQHVDRLRSIRVIQNCFRWGNNEDLDELKSTAGLNNWAFSETEDLNQADQLVWVLGSDLIYCVDVLEPLLEAAVTLMRLSNQRALKHARFYLSQSFKYDEETESEIGRICRALRLERRIVADSLTRRIPSLRSSEEPAVKVQMFSLQS